MKWLDRLEPAFRHHMARRPLRGAHLITFLLVAACSSDPGQEGDEPSGDGGTSSGGLTSGSGGYVGSGGAFTSGGADTAAGGTPAAGGVLFSTGGDGSTGGAAGGTGGALPNAGGSPGVGGDGGTGGTPDGSGGATEQPFSPCPDTQPCKVLPLGDSITVGWGSTGYGSYRVPLFRLCRNDGHDITFTGTKMDGPNLVDGVNFPRKHEGIAGETISQIAGRVDGALAAETPHIVILHAGTNDVNYSPMGAEARLEDLVDQLITDLPDALIVVSNIIPFPQYSDRVASFNASVRPMIEERQQQGAHVVFVDQFEGYPAGSELPDGVHPNDAGYSRMADKWYAAIENYLP